LSKASLERYRHNFIIDKVKLISGGRVLLLLFLLMKEK
jgi:hypothetical protein